jgi:hypothetical protein
MNETITRAAQRSHHDIIALQQKYFGRCAQQRKNLKCFKFRPSMPIVMAAGRVFRRDR